MSETQYTEFTTTPPHRSPAVLGGVTHTHFRYPEEGGPGIGLNDLGLWVPGQETEGGPPFSPVESDPSGVPPESVLGVDGFEGVGVFCGEW